MQIGFFFWPFTADLVRGMAAAAERYGYEHDRYRRHTPGNAMDPWVAATLVAEATVCPRIALCVSNLESRHPAASACRSLRSSCWRARSDGFSRLGTGHSGTRNIGLARSRVGALADGARFIRELLAERALRRWQGGEAYLPWVKRPSPVFLAAPRDPRRWPARRPRRMACSSISAGRRITWRRPKRPSPPAQRRPAATRARSGPSRSPRSITNADGAASRRKIGAILAFVAGGYILQGDLAARGVPTERHAAVGELRRRYSTHPGAADAALVDDLGLFDYLSRRFAIYGTPEQCPASRCYSGAEGGAGPRDVFGEPSPPTRSPPSSYSAAKCSRRCAGSGYSAAAPALARTGLPDAPLVRCSSISSIERPLALDAEQKRDPRLQERPEGQEKHVPAR